MAFTYQDMGRAFHKYILRIFCNGWMDCKDTFYEVYTYQLTGAPIINP